MPKPNCIAVGKAISLARLFKQKTPINVMWRITNRCNSKCAYCEIRKNNQQDLTMNQIISLIDQMVVCGTQRIGFVGGEALLRKDFERIVDYVKSKGIYVTLVSNGCLVPDHIETVKRLDYLVISFDGKKQNHERGRHKGSFDNVMKAIESCSENDIRILTNTVLTKHNLHDIDYILSTAKKYGFRCTFNVLQAGGDLCPTNSEYRTALDHLITRKKEGAPIVLSIKTMKFLKDWPDYKTSITEEKVRGFRCWAGQLIFNIDTDGKIAACDIMTHLKENNPSCIELGFANAMENVQKDGCRACTCAHVIEYNYMMSLSPTVIVDWYRLINQ